MLGDGSGEPKGEVWMSEGEGDSAAVGGDGDDEFGDGPFLGSHGGEGLGVCASRGECGGEMGKGGLTVMFVGGESARASRSASLMVARFSDEEMLDSDHR